MTNDIQMKQSSEDAIEEVDTEKQKKIQEKLKDMGVMPSDENEADKEEAEKVETEKLEPEKSEPDTAKPRRFSPVLVTVLLAFSAAGVLAYTFMYDEVAELLSLNKTPDNSVNEKDLTSKADNTVNPDFAYPGSQNPPANLAVDSRNRDYRSAQDQYREQSQRNHDQWVARQRADFDKRRAEFMKQNAQVQSQFNQPGFNQPRLNQPDFNQPDPNQAPANQPQVNNQQAYSQPQWATVTPPEPPQWVKDQQAEAEKQRAEYMQEIKKQQEEMYNNRYNGNYAGYRRPEYFNHPRMNINQSQQNNSVQQAQPQQPAVAYQQNKRQYYNPYYNNRQPVYNNAPSYRYGPSYAPYGWQGRPYR